MAQHEESTPKKQRRTAKKTTKNADKKTSKKRTAKRTTKRASKPAAKTEVENPYASFDRSQLKDKQRVFQLAKLLDVPSKDLVIALSDLGVVKVAQSSLTRAESEQLLDALSDPATASSDTPDADKPEETKDADEKIRHRVRKDVENEIHQIEDKVNAELGSSERASEFAADQSADTAAEADQAEDAAAREPRADATSNGAAHDESSDGEADYAEGLDGASGSAAVETDTDTTVAKDVDGTEEDTTPDNDPLTDVEPDVTPAPEEEPAAGYAPIFKAPSRSRQRRRASRPQNSGKDDTAEKQDTQSVEDAHETARSEGRTGNKRRRARSRNEKSEHSSPANEYRDDAPADEPGADESEHVDEPKAIKGSARLEAKRRRRSEKNAEARKRSRIVSQAEFLARRESVERTMVVRERERHDGHGRLTQVGVLEDGLLVEHFVTSDEQTTLIGNIYLGRVQNVLPSMEAAFIDIGQGRNGVIYAGEIDWKSAGLGGRSRRIEHALKSGDQVVVQVTKDPVGHKGARLTTQISLAGRFLVYVPGGRSAGISRKLPAPERKRLKEILNHVVPGKGGAIIRTAAEGVSEEAIAADVRRLHTQWETIQEQAEREKASKGAQPVTLYEEPNLLIKVVRDLFNEDFTALIVDGKRPYNRVHDYVESVAPDLLDRVEKFHPKKHGAEDSFGMHRVDEQLRKALSRKVWLPSGGTLIIEHTEALTVIDVNTGKYTGSGGSLEETVTRNNLEAAEEIVRQIRLRDIGGMIVIDFIDMILPENQDLVLRRLKEALGRDRTRHQVSEVTSLGLVQMTRKRLGTGLLETFSKPCECCDGRGLILLDDPVEQDEVERPSAKRTKRRPVGEHPAARAMHSHDAPLAEEEIDELAGAVVAEDKDVPEEDAEKPSASRRRGRRGSGRGRGRNRRRDSYESQEQRDTRSDLGDDAAVADRSEGADESNGNPEHDADHGQSVDERSRNKERRQRRSRRGRGGANRRSEDARRDRDADSGDSAAGTPSQDDAAQDSPNGADADSQFDQAVEEFEKSPRRKRPTRGNSRSDRRPQRDEFVDQAHAQQNFESTSDDASAQIGSQQELDESARGECRDGNRDKRGNAGGRRGRNAQQRSKGGKRQGSASRDDGAEKVAPRRRRRRAVRRSTGASATQEQQQETPSQASDQRSQETRERGASEAKSGRGSSNSNGNQDSGKTRSGRRGRRRATRRRRS